MTTSSIAIAFFMISINFLNSNAVNVHKFIKCTGSMACVNETTWNWFLETQRKAQLILDLAYMELSGPVFVDINKQEVQDLTKTRELLCTDDTFSGFIFDNVDSKWDMFCAWNGGGVQSSCIIAPPMNQHRILNSTSGSFIVVQKRYWAEKLKEVRSKLGCGTLDQQYTSGELLLCRRDCTQAGMGIILYLISLVSILYSTCFLCNRQPQHQ